MFALVLNSQSIVVTFKIGTEQASLTKKTSLEDAKAPDLNETAEGQQVQIGNFNIRNGSFSYPINGGSYRNSEDVAFLIIPEAGEALKIAFAKLDLEKNFDYVSIHVWENNQFRLVGRYTGNIRPAPILAPEGRTLISFKSDNSFTKTGFQVIWYPQN